MLLESHGYLSYYCPRSVRFGGCIFTVLGVKSQATGGTGSATRWRSDRANFSFVSPRAPSVVLISLHTATCQLARGVYTCGPRSPGEMPAHTEDIDSAIHFAGNTHLCDDNANPPFSLIVSTFAAFFGLAKWLCFGKLGSGFVQ